MAKYAIFVEGVYWWLAENAVDEVDAVRQCIKSLGGKGDDPTDIDTTRSDGAFTGVVAEFEDGHTESYDVAECIEVPGEAFEVLDHKSGKDLTPQILEQYDNVYYYPDDSTYLLYGTPEETEKSLHFIRSLVKQYRRIEQIEQDLEDAGIEYDIDVDEDDASKYADKALEALARIAATEVKQ